MKEAKFAFVACHLGEYKVSAMCRALGVTRRGYYLWAGRPASKHALRDLELARMIGGEYEASMGIYGAPKTFMRPKTAGVSTSQKRVARIMRENGRRGVTRACARRPSGEKRAAKQDFHNDPVRRDFSADGPNKAWFADITYVRTHQGWLYLSVVMDAWSCRVVGWSMGAEDDRRAGGRRAQDGHSPQAPPGGLHTPLGPRLPIRQPAFGQDDEGERHQALHGAHIVPMGQRGYRVPHGPECVHARTFDSREQAVIAPFDYIERFYNRLRIHSALGWLSPAEFEAASMEKSRTEAA